jgi:hypothetical protein
VILIKIIALILINLFETVKNMLKKFYQIKIDLKIQYEIVHPKIQYNTVKSYFLQSIQIKNQKLKIKISELKKRIQKQFNKLPVYPLYFYLKVLLLRRSQ